MDMSLKSSQANRWIWIASIWSGFGLIAATQTVFVMRAEGMHHAWARLFFTSAFSFLPWALATDAVMRLGRRFPPVKLKPVANWFIHLASCAALGLLYAAWSTWLDKVLNPYANSWPEGPFIPIWLNRYYSGILSSLIVYATILAVSSVVESRSRLAYQQTETARLNEQLSKAQLDALRRQIEPHFLFNTLNSIAALIPSDPARAEQTVGNLASLLRFSLNANNTGLVPLAQELKIVRDYLEIERTRFGDRLRYAIDVPDALGDVKVPPLALQSLAENSVKHVVSKRPQGASLQITGSIDSNRVCLAVLDNGPGFSLGAITPEHGLGNLIARMELVYGAAGQLEVARENDKTVVRLIFPA